MNWSFCGGGGRIRCRYTLQVYRKVATSVCTGGSNMPLACCKLFFRIHLCTLPNKKAQSVRTGLFAWWGRTDSNHRSETQQIYSLSPLATRELPHMKFYLIGAGRRTRTPDLLITNQLLYRLSYTGNSNRTRLL